MIKTRKIDLETKTTYDWPLLMIGDCSRVVILFVSSNSGTVVQREVHSKWKMGSFHCQVLDSRVFAPYKGTLEMSNE